jgi:hypothetical protein
MAESHAAGERDQAHDSIAAGDQAKRPNKGRERD